MPCEAPVTMTVLLLAMFYSSCFSRRTLYPDKVDRLVVMGARAAGITSTGLLSCRSGTWRPIGESSAFLSVLQGRRYSRLIIDEHDAVAGLAGAKMVECIVDFRHREGLSNGSNGMPGTEGEHSVDGRR